MCSDNKAPAAKCLDNSILMNSMLPLPPWILEALKDPRTVKPQYVNGKLVAYNITLKS